MHALANKQTSKSSSNSVAFSSELFFIEKVNPFITNMSITAQCMLFLAILATSVWSLLTQRCVNAQGRNYSTELCIECSIPLMLTISFTLLNKKSQKRPFSK